MRFLVDAQLPAALARWLEGAGQVADHVQDLGMQGAPDAVIWEFAVRENAVIISKDEDFAQRKMLVSDGPTVIWIRLGNTRKQELLAWVERAWPIIQAALERGETLIEAD